MGPGVFPSMEKREGGSENLRIHTILCPAALCLLVRSLMVIRPRNVLQIIHAGTVQVNTSLHLGPSLPASKEGRSEKPENKISLVVVVWASLLRVEPRGSHISNICMLLYTFFAHPICAGWPHFEIQSDGVILKSFQKTDINYTELQTDWVRRLQGIRSRRIPTLVGQEKVAVVAGNLRRESLKCQYPAENVADPFPFRFYLSVEWNGPSGLFGLILSHRYKI